MSDRAGACFHCALPLGAQVYALTIENVRQLFCCIGCQMVAQTIIDNGLQRYYEFRDEPSASQLNLVPPELLELNQYNLPDIQARYVMGNEPSLTNKSVILSIDQITCAACVWLLEKRLLALPGVIKFTVNLTNHRAELIWRDDAIHLADIFYQIAKIGYQAQLFEVDREERQRKLEYRRALKRLAVSGFGFGQVMMFAAPLYDWFAGGIPDYYRDFFRLVSLVVTTPVLIYCGWPFFQSAWLSLKARLLTMDVSISLALLTVYLAGIYATVARTGEVYFDSITMFLFFITLSRYLEMRARHRAGLVVQQLSHHQAEWVTRLRDDASEVVPFTRLQVNDLIIVKSGATIPVDGVVTVGMSSVSEALLTGESLPKLKQAGDAVVAGSMNIGHPLTICVTKVGDDTTLAAIIRLFERAQYEKPRIVSLTQQFSHYFVVVQIIAALALFVFWSMTSISQAFWTTISLLVISCPCALAMATPIALTAAMNAFSRHGFLCTRGHVVEGLADLTDIVFDKTGTLTEGKFSLHSIEVLADTWQEEELLEIATALEAQSEHPIASAFQSNPRSLLAEKVEVHPNLGVTGVVNGECYSLGSAAWIATDSQLFSLKNERALTPVVLAANQKPLAIFYLEDRLRPFAKATIQALMKKGYAVHLLSGDNRMTVQYYANLLGVTHAHAEQSPAAKLAYVKALQARGANVGMLGDGINDAPVLMQAQVSIAMANASDLTRVSADAVLMKNDFSVLLDVLSHARKTDTIIKQCLVWAVVYNVICLPLAVTGRVAPYVAAILMSVSSILVVANALRLMVIKKNKSASELALSLQVVEG